MAIFYLFVINYVSEFRNAPCTPSSEGILAGQLADKRNRGRQKSTRQQVRVFVARSAEDRLRSLFSYGTADGYRLAGGWMISCDACARSRPTARGGSLVGLASVYDFTTLQQTTCLDFVRFILSDSTTV